MAPEVTVVIVTHNSAASLPRTLHALTPRPDIRMQLVVVDNDSDPHELSAVQAHLPPDAVLIPNRENQGFAAGANTGAAAARGDWILLLNPDCVISTAALRDLVGQAEGHRLELVAPLVLTQGRRQSLPAGMGPSGWRFLVQYLGVAYWLGHASRLLRGFNLYQRNVLGGDGRPRSPLTRVDWVSGGCLLVTRRLWDRLDGFDSRWFMYGEDVDLCLRAIRAGTRPHVVATVRAHHDLGTGSTNQDPHLRMAWLRNLRDVVRRRRGLSAALRLDVALLIGAAIVSATRRRPSFGRPDLRLLWRHVLHDRC